MPKRSSHKMASKQAQLGKKKRKGKPNVYVPPKRETSSEVAQPLQQESTIAEEVVPDAVPSQQIKTSAPRFTKRERVSTSAMETYSYVWPEVRRIGTITALISVILVVLTILLR